MTKEKMFGDEYRGENVGDGYRWREVPNKKMSVTKEKMSVTSTEEKMVVMDTDGEKSRTKECR